MKNKPKVRIYNCGRLVKECKDDVRYMVGVSIPQQGTAYIFVMLSENAIELIGKAVLTPKGE